MQGNNKRYKRLIFDADHTLLDYLADERAAFVRTYAALNMPLSEELLALSRHASETAWTEAGLYDVHDKNTQEKYHLFYRSHLEEVFTRVFAAFPCPKKDITPRLAGDMFLKELETGGNYIAGAEETLCALSDKTGGSYEIYIATNGLSEIQRGRLQGLNEYLHGVYISEEIGAIKPLPAFFNAILKDGVKAGECLMIGDSLSSDIAGAHAVGMDACWFNPKGLRSDGAPAPEYEIRGLSELTLLKKQSIIKREKDDHFGY
ncbi:MAG: HAD-IA family hydrolase [Clostridia bacterium]|nr:HAD-IA family hydrolase [Clostridia bacterium]